MPIKRRDETHTPSTLGDIDTSVPEISMKNTKQELLSAYQQVLQRLERPDDEPPQAKVEAERRRQEGVMTGARGATVGNIVSSLGTLKLEIGSVLNNVSQKLVEQVEKFRQVEEATALEAKRLAELHDIEIVGDTLALLVARQREAEAEFDARIDDKTAKVQALLDTAKQDTEARISALRSEFDAEVSEKRKAWANEQMQHDAEVRERSAGIARGRAREQDEYQYTLQRTRERDNDVYNSKCEAQEKELTARRQEVERNLASRQEALAACENELQALRDKVQVLPNELQAAVLQARRQAREEALAEAKAAVTLRNQEVAGEKELLRHRIESLQAKCAEQATHLTAVNAQLAEASTKVQDIAVRAIEGASNRRALDAVNEIALEQAKQKRPS